MFRRIWNFLTGRALWWVILWVVHGVLVVGITLGLYAVNRNYHLETDLRIDQGSRRTALAAA